jgi:hypothetical protein
VIIKLIGDEKDNKAQLGLHNTLKSSFYTGNGFSSCNDKNQRALSLFTRNRKRFLFYFNHLSFLTLNLNYRNILLNRKKEKYSIVSLIVQVRPLNRKLFFSLITNLRRLSGHIIPSRKCRDKTYIYNIGFKIFLKNFLFLKFFSELFHRKKTLHKKRFVAKLKLIYSVHRKRKFAFLRNRTIRNNSRIRKQIILKRVWLKKRLKRKKLTKRDLNHITKFKGKLNKTSIEILTRLREKERNKQEINSRIIKDIERRRRINLQRRGGRRRRKRLFFLRRYSFFERRVKLRYKLSRKKQFFNGNFPYNYIKKKTQQFLRVTRSLRKKNVLRIRQYFSIKSPHLHKYDNHIKRYGKHYSLLRYLNIKWYLRRKNYGNKSYLHIKRYLHRKYHVT